MQAISDGTDEAVMRWLQSPLGQQLWVCESAAAAACLEHVFGLQALQVGLWGEPTGLLAYCRTQRRGIAARRGGPGVTICCEPDSLPIASDSVDLVLLPHTLESEAEPHQVLREIERILVGEGHLLVLGFNPWSLVGLRRLLSRGRFPPELRRLVPEGKLRDWMSLLGFDVLEVRRHFYTLPLGRRLQVAAGAYALLGRKRVYTLTPLRPRWRRRARAVGGIVEPTTRTSA